MSTSSEFSGETQGNYPPPNYPPPGDTTSEGGYGGQGGVSAFAPVTERGLIDQTTNGQPLGDEMEDAWQGTDEQTTKAYREEQKNPPGGDSTGLNPYGESLETRGEAEARLKAGATDKRARTYQDEIPDLDVSRR